MKGGCPVRYGSAAKKSLALIIMLPLIAAGDDDCGSGCSGSTESCPPPVAEKLSGVWDYQRDVNGGWRNSANGGQTVWWLVTFQTEPGLAKFGVGKIYENDPDFGIDVVWQHSGGQIEAQYELSGDNVTFWFDDMMAPRRTSFSGQRVRAGRIEGADWVASVCDIIDQNC